MSDATLTAHEDSAPASGPRGCATVALAGTLRLAARVAAVLALAVCAIALVVGVTAADTARRWLSYRFAGIPARPGEAAAIFLHNVHALAAIGGLLLAAQSSHWTGKPRGGVHRAVQRAGETLLAAGVAANVILVGASLGAYGARMVRAVLPHGPVELGAYAFALALYLQGRDEPLAGRHAVAVAALSVWTLAAAAVLETFVNL